MSPRIILIITLVIVGLSPTKVHAESSSPQPEPPPPPHVSSSLQEQEKMMTTLMTSSNKNTNDETAMRRASTQKDTLPHDDTITRNSKLKVENGLGRLPPMGYNTWNDVGCNVTEFHVLHAANVLKTTGLQKLGFIYVNIDDCWSELQRDPITKTLVANHITFPSGIKSLAGQLHKSGFKVGIYGDRGVLTCQRRPGSKGYEMLDATTYANWGIDFLKEDSCYASPVNHDIAFQEYRVMRDSLNATRRDIFFSLCGWFPFYAQQGHVLGNSWRINSDIVSWNGVYASARFMEKLYQYSGPGGFNDPDLLLGSNKKSWLHLTPRQSRTQFSLWCVMAAPLLLSTIPDDPFDLMTYGNPHAIAINQDLLGFAGRPCASTCPPHLLPSYESFRAIPPRNCVQVWYKKLAANNGVALVLVNWDPVSTLDVVCSHECLKRAGLGSFGGEGGALKIIPVYGDATPSYEVTNAGILIARRLQAGESVFLEVRRENMGTAAMIK